MCTSPAIAFDSGLVDLNDAFGLNAKDSDRVLFRRRTTCSILSLENRTEIVNASDVPFSTFAGRDALPNEEVTQYHYGKFSDEAPNTPTFIHSFVTGNITRSITSLHIISRAAVPSEERLILIPELQRQDADVSLPEKGSSCTDLRGMIVDDPIKALPGANEFQLELMKLLIYTPQNFDISRSDRYQAQAKYNSAGSISGLPDEQWIQELQLWEATVWAEYQIIVSDHAIGPTVRDASSQKYYLSPENDAEKKLCHAQKMRKQGGFVLRKRSTPRLDRWVQDGIFQLQRRAYEAHTDGIWKDLDKEVPVTIEKTNLPDLPIESPLNPLCRVCQEANHLDTTQSLTVIDTGEQVSKCETNDELEHGQKHPDPESITKIAEKELNSPSSGYGREIPEAHPAQHGKKNKEA
ncbi:hypothetical protein N0V90_005980 [Kalmusia sp. IMI 367209]|nr:hypothetical protein N0V90_005980 [Kalmusia sp. IMI 367209]